MKLITSGLSEIGRLIRKEWQIATFVAGLLFMLLVFHLPEKIEKIPPEELSARYAYCIEGFNRGEYDEIKPELERIIELLGFETYGPEPDYVLGVTLWQVARASAAESTPKAAYGEDLLGPGFPGSEISRKATSLLVRAIKRLEKAIGLNLPGSASVQEGWRVVPEKDWKALGRRPARPSLDNEGRIVEILESLALAHRMLGDYDNSDKAFKLLYENERNPSYYPYRFETVRNALKNGEYETALARLQSYLEAMIAYRAAQRRDISEKLQQINDILSKPSADFTVLASELGVFFSSSTKDEIGNRLARLAAELIERKAQFAADLVRDYRLTAGLLADGVTGAFDTIARDNIDNELANLESMLHTLRVEASDSRMRGVLSAEDDAAFRVKEKDFESLIEEFRWEKTRLKAAGETIAEQIEFEADDAILSLRKEVFQLLRSEPGASAEAVVGDVVKALSDSHLGAPYFDEIESLVAGFARKAAKDAEKTVADALGSIEKAEEGFARQLSELVEEKEIVLAEEKEFRDSGGEVDDSDRKRRRRMAELASLVKNSRVGRLDFQNGLFDATERDFLRIESELESEIRKLLLEYAQRVLKDADETIAEIKAEIRKRTSGEDTEEIREYRRNKEREISDIQHRAWAWHEGISNTAAKKYRFFNKFEEYKVTKFSSLPRMTRDSQNATANRFADSIAAATREFPSISTANPAAFDEVIAKQPEQMRKVLSAFADEADSTLVARLKEWAWRESNRLIADFEEVSGGANLEEGEAGFMEGGIYIDRFRSRLAKGEVEEPDGGFLVSDPDLDKAERILKKTNQLEHYRGKYKILFNLAEVYFLRRDYPAAAANYEDTISNAGALTPIVKEAYLLKADCQRLMMKYDAAHSSLAKITVEDFDDKSLFVKHILKGFTYYDEGERELVVREFAESMSLLEKNPAIIKRNRFIDEVELFDRLEDGIRETKNPEARQAGLKAAVLLADNSALSGNMWERIAELHLWTGEGYQQLARFDPAQEKLARSEYYNAAQAFMKVIRLVEGDSKAYKGASPLAVRKDMFFRAAVALERARYYPAAILTYSDFLKTAEEDQKVPKARFRLAKLYQEIGDYAEAIREFWRCVEDEIANLPDTERSLLEIGLCFEALGRYDRAVEYFEMIFDAYKHNPSGFARDPESATWESAEYARGRVQYLAGKYNDAHRNLYNAVERYSRVESPITQLELNEARYYLGATYFKLGRYSDARDLFLTVKAKHRGVQVSDLIREKTWFGYADSLYFDAETTQDPKAQAELYDEARRAYVSAINNYPGSTDKPWGNMQIGNIYKALGDNDTALTYYERALNNIKGFTDEAYASRPGGMGREFDRGTIEWLRDSLVWQMARKGK